jgi:hypothetical protein
MAAEQRRTGVLNADKGPINKESKRPKQSVLELSERRDSAEQDLSHQNASSTRVDAVSDTRDSPDELQGEATTQPVPRFLEDKSNQARRKFNTDKPMFPVRKRSPTDIQPTDFAGSPPQGPKKIKRSHNRPDSILNVIYVRFGSVGKRVVKGASTTINLAPQKIELGEDIVGTGKKIEILIRNVRTVIRGIEPSLKLRLKLSQDSKAPGDTNVDIEFLVQSDKEKLVRVLQDSQIKALDKTG